MGFNNNEISVTSTGNLYKVASSNEFYSSISR